VNARSNRRLVVYAPVEFAERRESSCAHPDDEIFVFVAVVRCILQIQFEDRAMPVHRGRSAHKTFCKCTQIISTARNVTCDSIDTTVGGVA